MEIVEQGGEGEGLRRLKEGEFEPWQTNFGLC
jgi:hypothetical protein